jgi:hypothetical protein
VPDVRRDRNARRVRIVDSVADKSIGPVAALPYLRQVEASHHADRLGKTAASQIRRAEASLSRQQLPPGDAR